WEVVQRLGNVLGVPSPSRIRGPILVLRVGAARALIQLDDLVGQEEVVVKGLGALLTGHPVFAGGTARGTGAMAVILDVPAIVEAQDRATHRHRQVHELEDKAPRERDGKTSDVPPSGARAQTPSARPSPAADGSVRPPRIMFVDDSLSV